MSNFVKIQSGNFEALVRPENIAKVEAALAKIKGAKPGKPKTEAKRGFPVYKSGMSVGEYISKYESLNKHIGLHRAHDVLALDEHPATEYDPSIPLCVEDVNPDYVPGVDDAPVKAKRTRKAKKAAPDKAAVMWLLMDHGLTMYQANLLADKLLNLFEGV